MSVQHPCAIVCTINICVHVKNPKVTVAAILLFGHTHILYTPIGVGSAALVAAVPYSGKATRLNFPLGAEVLKSTTKKQKNNNTYCCRQYPIPDSNIPDNSKFCERALILRRAPCTDQTLAQFLIFGLSHKKTGQDQREIRTCSSERIRTWRAINTSVLIVTFCSTNLIYRIYVGGSIHVEEAAGSESLGKDDG